MLTNYIKRLSNINWMSNIVIVIFLLLNMCHVIKLGLFGTLIGLITLAFNIIKANYIRIINKNI